MNRLLSRFLDWLFKKLSERNSRKELFLSEMRLKEQAILKKEAEEYIMDFIRKGGNDTYIQQLDKTQTNNAIVPLNANDYDRPPMVIIHLNGIENCLCIACGNERYRKQQETK